MRRRIEPANARRAMRKVRLALIGPLSVVAGLAEAGNIFPTGLPGVSDPGYNAILATGNAIPAKVAGAESESGTPVEPASRGLGNYSLPVCPGAATPATS